MKSAYLILPVPVLLIIGSSLVAEVIHVPGDSTTIQGGINVASPGDTVMIDPGTYYEHDLDFLGKAITVTGTDPGDSAVVASTRVDGNSQGSVFLFQSGEDSMSVLAGLTVTGGYASNGGGVYCYGSSPTITSNTIGWNAAEESGGGIYLDHSSGAIRKNSIVENRTGDPRWNYGAGAGIYCGSSSLPTIFGNLITANYSYGDAGGIACAGDSSSPVILHNTITENSSYREGGGIGCWLFSSPVIMDNLITGNWTRSANNDLGGGVYCEQSDPEISNNTISDNSSNSGGGIACTDSSSPSISRNVIADNSGKKGGGIFCDSSNPAISNNTISTNSASYYGGGIHCDNSSPVIANNTIAGNSGPPYGGGIYCENGSNTTITNSIFRANEAGWAGPEIALSDSSTLTIGYSDVEGGQDSVYIEAGSVLNWGAGMIDADPLFVSFRGFDYLLRHGSPCIDAGDPAMEDGFAWPPRYPNDPRSDMGAYGGPGNAGWLP